MSIWEKHKVKIVSAVVILLIGLVFLILWLLGVFSKKSTTSTNTNTNTPSRKELTKGSSCSSYNDCSSLLECRNGVCSDPLHSVGGSCTSSLDCISGLECRDRVCKNPLHSVGGDCTSNLDCISGLECRDRVCKNPLHSVGGSCTSTSDCTSGLECRNGVCLNPYHSLSFGKECIDNSECKSDMCDAEYNKCFIRPQSLTTTRPFDCGYQDDTQGYYPGENETSPAKFCRNVGSGWKACVKFNTDGSIADQYVRQETDPAYITTNPSQRIPLIPSDQCYLGQIIR